MSRETWAGDDRLSLDPGTQALVSLDSMESLFRRLPRSAYDRLLVVSSKHPSVVADRLDGVGADLRSVGQIPVTGTESDYDGPMWTSQPVVPDDLTGLSMRLSRAMEGLDSGGWLLFDALNVFLMYASEDRVVRFHDYTAGQASERDVRGVYTIVRAAVDDGTYEALCRCTDAEIDLR